MAGTARSTLPTRESRHDSGVLAAPRAPRVRVPVVGDLLRLRTDLLNAIQHAASAGDEVTHVRAGTRHMVFVHRSAPADAVLSDIRTFGKPDHRNPLRLVLGDGLVSNPDHDDWLRRRRALQPVYSRAGVAGMRRKAAEVAAGHTARWGRRDRTRLHVYEEMLAFTLDTVSTCMFSRSGDSVSGAVTPATAAFLLDFVQRRIRKPVSLPVGVPTPRHRRFAATLRGLDAMVHGIVAERRASGRHHGDLLDLLLDARVGEAAEPLTDTQIRDEVLTTILAGFETTASALTWTLYLLACYPEVQEAVRREVRSSAASDPAEPLRGTLLHGVIHESMRLFPPSPTIPRQATRDTSIGPEAVPQGALVMLNVAAVHRDPAVWEQPDSFIPERFAGGTPEKGSYLPFGAGGHMCIGKGFALMEMGLLLADVVDRFEISPCDAAGPEPRALITLRPRDRFGLTLTRI
ncbi:hypothetical protein BU52_28345 [Streptomyces toyocaensis]|uniref:Cytochrome P450 n=1 Tax=Streptomyces toyocaensis TaxID=55952 RepID=A0A081XK13_STRTO|nr:cytochrome P450 [Streptomyces toyocaensis]KES03886.1 hypothetical protein BU52_28345 [Streptomyces toyocaensis]